MFQERRKYGSGNPARVNHQQRIVCVGSGHGGADLGRGQTAELVDSKADKSISLFVERGQWPERDRQENSASDVCASVQRRPEHTCFEAAQRIPSRVSPLAAAWGVCCYLDHQALPRVDIEAVS